MARVRGNAVLKLWVLCELLLDCRVRSGWTTSTNDCFHGAKWSGMQVTASSRENQLYWVSVRRIRLQGVFAGPVDSVNGHEAHVIHVPLSRPHKVLEQNLTLVAHAEVCTLSPTESSPLPLPLPPPREQMALKRKRITNSEGAIQRAKHADGVESQKDEVCTSLHLTFFAQDQPLTQPLASTDSSYPASRAPKPHLRARTSATRPHLHYVKLKGTRSTSDMPSDP